MSVDFSHLLNFEIVSDSFLKVDHEIFDVFKADSGGINSELNETLMDIDFDFSGDSEKRWDGSSGGKVCVGNRLDSTKESLELSCQLGSRDTEGGSEVL